MTTEYKVTVRNIGAASSGRGKTQALKAYRRSRLKRNPGNRPVKIYGSIHMIAASKAGMKHKCSPECRRAGHRYQHVFKNNACIYGLPDGSILVK
jgi:hypothetical protein